MYREYKIAMGTDNPQEVKGILKSILPKTFESPGVGNPSRYLSYLLSNDPGIGVKEAFEKASQNYYAWAQAYYPTVDIFQQSGKDILRLVTNDYRVDLTIEYNNGGDIRWYGIEVSSDKLGNIKNVSEKIGMK